MSLTAPNAEVHRLNQQLVADFFGAAEPTPDDFKRMYEEFLASFEVPADATFEDVVLALRRPRCHG